MSDYDESRAASLEIEINDFRERLRKIRMDDRSPEALAEIAVQLMRLNAGMDLLEAAVHRVADNG